MTLDSDYRITVVESRAKLSISGGRGSRPMPRLSPQAAVAADGMYLAIASLMGDGADSATV